MSTLFAWLLRCVVAVSDGVCREGTCPPEGQSGPKYVPFPRVNDLSMAEFEAEYMQKKPVVMRHPPGFGLADLLRECPNWSITIKRASEVEAPRKMVGLRDAGRMKVTDLVAGWKKGKGMDNYAWEADVACKCPQLLANITVHPFYAHDEWWLERSTGWPTIILGMAGTRVHLHVDPYGIPVVVHVLEGKKQFRLITVDDVDAYMPGWFENRGVGRHAGVAGPSFQPLDLFDDEEVKRLLDPRITVWDVTMEPGDMVYFPASNVHAARNLAGPTLSVSSNYLDREHAVWMLPRIEEVEPESKREKRRMLIKDYVDKIADVGEPGFPAEGVPFLKRVSRGVPWCAAKLFHCYSNENRQPRDLLRECHKAGMVQDLKNVRLRTLLDSQYHDHLGDTILATVHHLAGEQGNFESNFER